jgi:fumarate reductase subunit C
MLYISRIVLIKIQFVLKILYPIQQTHYDFFSYSIILFLNILSLNISLLHALDLLKPLKINTNI